MALYPLLRPLAFALDAERAHRATIAALRLVPPGEPATPETMLQTTVAGVSFPNPVGLAAGFDKDAEVWRQMLGFGFGFVEVGTLTPRGQPGNSRPRLFRLVEDRAVINRMGFNNGGQAAARARLERRKARQGIVGVNIGANREAISGGVAIADYVAGVAAFRDLADYLALNISSPNTPGLRELQRDSALQELLAAVIEARGAGPPLRPPIFLKVAPDLEQGEIDRIARVAIEGKVDALIVGNTTVSRPPLRSRHRDEAGGLSGEPLKALALERLRDFRRATGGTLPLIACGGIENGVDALERVKAGASLVQLYTALVYDGPGLAEQIIGELKRLLAIEGFGCLADAIGAEAD